MALRRIIKLFKNNSISISGRKGRGKDMLMGNIVIRRKKQYVSNIDYGGKYIPYNYSDIDIKSVYTDFINGTVKHYEFPYKDGTDIYLSDCGVYFPSQYCNELNKQYKSLPSFMALSRQLGKCSVHTNSQRLNRVWDKIREQSDTYILCRKCLYIPWIKLVIQKVTIYDKYESALEEREPLIIPQPLLSNKETRMAREIKLREYKSQHGTIKNKWLIYFNKSKYDTRYFKTLLKEGEKNEEKNT